MISRARGAILVQAELGNGHRYTEHARSRCELSCAFATPAIWQSAIVGLELGTAATLGALAPFASLLRITRASDEFVGRTAVSVEPRWSIVELGRGRAVAPR